MFQNKVEVHRHTAQPFSSRLNQFILDWWERNKHLFSQYSTPQFIPDDADKTFDVFTQHWKQKGTIPMWYDENDDNIFASREVNAKFRAWHDFIHVMTGNDFSLQGEINSYEVQQSFIPREWEWERALMKAEIVGQAEYYTKNGMGSPIPSQREFALNYIESLTSL